MTAASERSVGYGASLVAVSQVITVAAAGILGIVVAQVLGPAGTGAFNLVQTALALVVLFASLGIENGLMYHVGGGRWPAAAALRHTTAAAAVLGLAGAVIGVVVGVLTSGSLFDGVPVEVVVLGMLAAPFMLAWTYGSFLALSTGDYAAYLRGPATQAAVGLVLVAPAALLWGLEGAIAALTVSHAVAAGTLRWRLGRRLGASGPGSAARARMDLGAAVRFGMPAQLTNWLSMLSYRADLFVLNAVSTTASVGHYAVATSLTSLGWVAPRAVSAVILPRVASLESACGDVSQDELMAKAVRHAVILAAVTTAMLAAGAQLIPLVYGGDFEPAVELALLLLPGIATLGVGNVLASSILGKGQPRYNLITAGIVAPITVALYLVVVPAHGAAGAAVASSVSYTVSALLLLHFFRRVTGIREFRRLVPRGEDVADYRALASSAWARIRRASS